MTVTKQQQLEWMAKTFACWPVSRNSIKLSDYTLGSVATDTDYSDYMLITQEEWQLERKKLIEQQRVEQDNSWYERGELPPVGCVCMCTNSTEPVEVLRHRVNNTGTPVAAVMNTKTFHLFWTYTFSPIKTEREKAIDEMRTISGVGADFWSLTLRPFAELLYDEGWRKK